MTVGTVEGGTVAFWDTLDPYSQCRVSALARPPADAASPAPPSIGRSMGPSRVASRLTAKLWHPDNPLFWFGALGVVTVSGMALSSGRVNAGAHARVGPVAAEAEVGHEHEED